MDQDKAIIGRLKILGVFVLLLVVGLFKGCSDVRFAVSGEKADATFMEFSKMVRTRGRESSKQYVRYRFTDKAGTSCIGYDTVSRSWRPPADGILKVVYLPGKMEVDKRNTVSRLQESSGFVGALFLVVGLVGTVVWGFFTMRSMEQTAPR